MKFNGFTKKSKGSFLQASTPYLLCAEINTVSKEGLSKYLNKSNPFSFFSSISKKTKSGFVFSMAIIASSILATESTIESLLLNKFPISFSRNSLAGISSSMIKHLNILCQSFRFLRTNQLFNKSTLILIKKKIKVLYKN